MSPGKRFSLQSLGDGTVVSHWFPTWYDRNIQEHVYKQRIRKAQASRDCNSCKEHNDMGDTTGLLQSPEELRRVWIGQAVILTKYFKVYSSGCQVIVL